MLSTKQAATISPRQMHPHVSSSPVKKAMKRARQEGEAVTTPAIFLQSVFEKAGLKNPGPKAFQKPGAEDTAAYNMDVVRAIRARKVELLREMHAAGSNMNACNQFGESLLHMACRRADVDTVAFLVREAMVNPDVRDDFGRNPFHDALWTSVPNTGVMDILLEVADPVMLIAEDVRGNTPFEYTRREHHVRWMRYLNEKKDLFETKIRQATKGPEVPKEEPPVKIEEEPSVKVEEPLPVLTKVKQEDS